MNILKILMNTQFTPFAEFDCETYGGDYIQRNIEAAALWRRYHRAFAGASEHAQIGEYRDMVIVIEGSALDPSSIEVFDESGECIYSGYVTKDGLGIRQYDPRGLRS